MGYGTDEETIIIGGRLSPKVNDYLLLSTLFHIGLGPRSPFSTGECRHIRQPDLTRFRVGLRAPSAHVIGSNAE